MKKIIAAVICILMLVSVFSACGGKSDADDTGNKGDSSEAKINVICTIFPEYDWVRALVGERSDKIGLTLLLDSGIDLHNYQPTAEDIVNVSKCDMFVYVGGESDAWVEDVLDTAQNDKMIAVNLLDVLEGSIVEEEFKEGMEPHEEEEEEGEEEEGPEYDEHVWLSVRNAVKICQVLADKLCELDPDGKDVYTANNTAYAEKLNALDARYTEAFGGAAVKTMVFADRFPFRYMVNDYGVDYYAAFVGCSTESEASFKTVTFLADQLDELGLKSVFVIEGTDHKIADSVISNTKDQDQKVFVLDSMQGITAGDVEKGVTYLSIMENNLTVLGDALK